VKNDFEESVKTQNFAGMTKCRKVTVSQDLSEVKRGSGQILYIEKTNQGKI
jgi:hypothetical protein